ncbi:TPA: preprotein translocase subunit SecE [bacterium]|nr:preprotein translocase subunit SecE [bacterium]
MFKKLIKFLQEVRQEMKKVVWPTRKEISGSTIVVIILVVIVSIYLGIIDNILQQLMLRLVNL